MRAFPNPEDAPVTVAMRECESTMVSQTHSARLFEGALEALQRTASLLGCVMHSSGDKSGRDTFTGIVGCT